MRHLIPQLRAGRLTCSYYEALELIEGTPVVPGTCGHRQTSDKAAGSFQKLPNLAAAIDTAYYGWSEGATAAMRHPEYAEVFGMGEVRSTSWSYNSEEGDFTTERLLGGADTFLLKPTFTHRFATGLRVIVIVSTSCGIDGETMMQQAIAIAAGLWQLERRRIPVELWTVICLGQDGTKVSAHQTLQVHTSGNTFNLGKLTFACGHPDYLRRINFALMERADTDIQQVEYQTWYGYPATFKTTDVAKLNLPRWDGDTLIIGNATSNDVTLNNKRVMNAYRKVFHRLDSGEAIESGIIELI
jgi:hypothetical protein